MRATGYSVGDGFYPITTPEKLLREQVAKSRSQYAYACFKVYFGEVDVLVELHIGKQMWVLCKSEADYLDLFFRHLSKMINE
jgi:hypothetical protein